MFLFGKNKKKEEAPAPKPVTPKSVTLPPPAKPLNADDFFGDIDNRKKTRKPASIDIETPEVVGLREKPAEAPEQHFRNVATQELSMNTLHEEDYQVDAEALINFKDIAADESAVDALKDKSAEEFFFDPDAPEPEKTASPVFDPNDPDAFFRNMGRKPKKQKFSIDLPDVTGLRETPEVVEADKVKDIDISTINTGVLRDEPVSTDSKEYRNISEISSDSIDTSVLRN